MTQVQVRLSDAEVDDLDTWVEEGRFKSRSDAIRGALRSYKEQKETRKFYTELQRRSDEAEQSENVVPLEEL